MNAKDNDNGNSIQESQVCVVHREDSESLAHGGNNANINNANMNDVFALDFADDKDLVD